MNDIGLITFGQTGASRQFDYKAALASVDDKIFHMLGRNTCSLIERYVAGMELASHTRLKGEMHRLACSLSIMAGYLGATPVERLAHEIELLLADTNFELIDHRLETLKREIECFLPVLNERLAEAPDTLVSRNQ